MNGKELFTNRKDVDISINFGFIGLGQAGGKKVDSFYEFQDRNRKPYYTGIAVNSFIGDLKALNNVPEAHRYVLKAMKKGVPGTLVWVMKPWKATIIIKTFMK